MFVIVQIFSTPHNHPKSQPFIDRVAQFSIADGKIWYRNYEIIDESGELVEIGKWSNGLMLELQLRVCKLIFPMVFANYGSNFEN